ncbi:MAG TPA: hypothetical protein VHA12_01480 [Candidatus Nanoarchaeia archaeon]|nr:hypothetical protein [Candidatus Nanoarchaeia archaeon]
MKRKILRNLQDYRPDFKKVVGKELILTGEYHIFVGGRRDESYGTIYGILEDFCSNSITLGNFVNYYLPVNVSSEEHEKTIRLFESLNGLRINKPVRVELTDKLQAYVIDFNK